MTFLDTADMYGPFNNEQHTTHPITALESEYSLLTRDPDDEVRAAQFPRFQGEALESDLALVEEIRSAAEGLGCTPGQLALAWVPDALQALETAVPKGAVSERYPDMSTIDR